MAITDGHDDDDDEEEEEQPADNNMIEEQDGEVHKVRRMTLDQFRSKLVNHFDIASTKKEVKWPVRNRSVEPPTV